MESEAASTDHAYNALPDIKPRTPIAALQRKRYASLDSRYSIETVARAVGMSPTFVRKVVGRQRHIGVREVLDLLDQDAFSETFVPRSQVIDFLESQNLNSIEANIVPNPSNYELRVGHVLDLAQCVPAKSVRCVVTSTPYWGMRVYEDTQAAHLGRWRGVRIRA